MALQRGAGVVVPGHAVGRPNKFVTQRSTDDPVVTVTIRILHSTLRRLRVEGAERELSVSDLISEALATRSLNPIVPNGLASGIRRGT